MSSGLQKPGLRANLSALIFGTVFVVMAAVFVWQTYAFNTVRRPSANYLMASLAGKDGAREALYVPSADDLAVALKAQPLNPVSVNAAIFAEVARKPGTMPAADRMALLGKLGWRSTTALQNRIFDAVQRQDLNQIVDIANALLRRDELVDQGRALMNLMEQAPSTHRQLVGALAERPSWRLSYFQSYGALTTQSQAEARGRLAKELVERGSPLNRAELLPTLQLMVAKGVTGPAYALWRDYRGIRRDALINDPQLSWAYMMRNDPLSDMPFEWRILTGTGFWTELVRDDGDVGVMIRWNREGVPDLMVQQTYVAQPGGSYMLEVEGDTLAPTLLEDLAFTLRCAGSVVRFDQPVRRSSSRIILRGDSALGCTDPVFAVTGRPRQFGSASSRNAVMGLGDEMSTTLTGLRIYPAGSGQTAGRPRTG